MKQNRGNPAQVSRQVSEITARDVVALVISDDPVQRLSTAAITYRCSDTCPVDHKAVMIWDLTKRTGVTQTVSIRTPEVAMTVIGVLMEEYGFWTDEEFRFASELIERRREAQARQGTGPDASAAQG